MAKKSPESINKLVVQKLQNDIADVPSQNGKISIKYKFIGRG